MCNILGQFVFRQVRATFRSFLNCSLEELSTSGLRKACWTIKTFKIKTFIDLKRDFTASQTELRLKCHVRLAHSVLGIGYIRIQLT